jgi:recombination protein RecA
MAKKKEGLQGADWNFVVAGLGKKFGKGLSLFQMNQSSIQMLKVDAIPTYLVGLDNALGIFGFPKGRIIEVYGPESGGKSSLALQTVVSVQKQQPKAPILYVDLEHALLRPWMETIGVSFDNLWVSQPDNAEQAAHIMIAAAESGKAPLIVLDSLAAMVPQAEIEGEMTDQQMGLVGRIMGKFCRKIVPALQRNGTTLLVINQTRAKLGPIPGEERPGGKALRFFASQILRVRKEKNIIIGGEIVGVWIEVTVRKNKVAPPFKTASIPLLFNSGFSPEMSLIETGTIEGFIQKSGSWYSYKGERLGQGVLNASDNITPEIFDSIYNKFKEDKLKGTIMLEETESETPGTDTELIPEEIITDDV